MTQLIVSGLLILSAVAEPRNSGKSAKSQEINKNMQNAAKFARNLIKYMPIQHIWNLCRPLGMFNCRKLANLSCNFITTSSKQRPKTIRSKLCCGKLDTSHDVKSFAIGSFLEHSKWLSQLKKTLNTLVKSVQNLSISRQICPENFHELGRFLPKISANLSLKIPRNLHVFFRNLSEAL